jgi:Bacterial antitoxin of type II TA system, VapB
MRTTIEINDVLLRQAKQVALERKLSLKAVVEAALRQFLHQTQAPQQAAFKLRKCSFKGEGLQPGLDWHDWEKIRGLIYEGRGG